MPAKRLSTVLIIALLGWTAWGQSKRPVVRKDSPDGAFLELIELESEPAKRLALMEQFPVMFPASPALVWIHEQVHAIHRDAGNLDRMLTAGEKILSLDPENLAIAHQNWKAAERKSEASVVKQWSDRAQQIAQRILSLPKPVDPDQLEVWQHRVALARQLASTEEYSLYKRALDTADPRKKIELLNELVKQYPQTTYRSQLDLLLFLAYKQVGATGKALAAAERVVEKEQHYPDALLFIADHYFRQERRSETVMKHSERIIALMSTLPAPAGVTEAEWVRQKNLYCSSAYFMIGRIQMEAQRWAASDQTLRNALPLVRENETMKAALLSTLGWVNYKMENFSEAIRFYKQCVTIRGPYQFQASQTLGAIEAEQQGRKNE